MAVSGDRLPQANHAALLARIEQLEKMVASSACTPEKKCMNQNCLHMGHLAEECFRKGGGKEGQYPAWWKGKRDTRVAPAANNFGSCISSLEYMLNLLPSFPAAQSWPGELHG